MQLPELVRQQASVMKHVLAGSVRNDAANEQPIRVVLLVFQLRKLVASDGELKSLFAGERRKYGGGHGVSPSVSWVVQFVNDA